MAIRIEKTFHVDAPPGKVWAFLTDPEAVASCLPGAAITEQVDDDTYAGTMKVKLGPVSASYRGRLTFERLDADARIAELSGRGEDTNGKGGARMKMTSRLEEAAGGTEVHVASDVEVTGMLAQFGRGMIENVSDQMFERFTAKMRERLEGEAAPGPAGEDAGEDDDEALDVGSVGVEAGKRAVGRAFRKLTGRGDENDDEADGNGNGDGREAR